MTGKNIVSILRAFVIPTARINSIVIYYDFSRAPKSVCGTLGLPIVVPASLPSTRASHSYFTHCCRDGTALRSLSTVHAQWYDRDGTSPFHAAAAAAAVAISCHAVAVKRY